MGGTQMSSFGPSGKQPMATDMPYREYQYEQAKAGHDSRYQTGGATEQSRERGREYQGKGAPEEAAQKQQIAQQCQAQLADPNCTAQQAAAANQTLASIEGGASLEEVVATFGAVADTSYNTGHVDYSSPYGVN